MTTSPNPGENAQYIRYYATALLRIRDFGSRITIWKKLVHAERSFSTLSFILLKLYCRNAELKGKSF